jgi:hypothetical protein
MKRVFVPVFLFAAALVFTPEARADCCPNALGAGWTTCADGTSSGGGCCGVGSCNIFCCNCDGGCRQSANKSQCYANCQGQRGLCWSGCDLTCGAAHDCEFCYMACGIALDQCKAGCDQRFASVGAQTVAPSSEPPASEARASLSGLVRFSEVDTNHDGYITKAEVQNWLKANPYMAGCATDKAFADADKDHNGRLTLDEVDETAAAWLKKNVGPQATAPQSTKAVVKVNPYLTTILKTLK